MKSDITQVSKLLRRAKVESTRMMIPHIGQLKEWTLMAISHVSDKPSTNIFLVAGM